MLVAVNLYPALYALLAKILVRRRHLHIMASVNTTDFATRKERRQMLFYRHVLPLMDTVIFGAASQRELWNDRYGLSNHKHFATVLYNGVDTTEFCRDAIRPITPNDWPETRVIVGTIGNLRTEKRQIDIVRAVAELRLRSLDIGAVIVGDGPQRGMIEREIERLHVERYVRLTGEVLDVRPHLAAMHIFVLPSFAVETFSNAALEAMAMGCPIVSSEIGGMEEMLQFGGGVTYPTGNIARLCSSLSELVCDPVRRERLGQEARRSAVEHFSISRMVSDFSTLLIG